MSQVVEGARSRAGLLALYLLAALAGRAAIVDGGQTALVWPAAGVAVAWLVTHSDRKAWLVDVPLLTLASAVVHVATGLSLSVTTVVVASNVVGTLGVALLVRSWSTTTGTSELAPLDTSRSLFGFLAATSVGCAVGVGVGFAGMLLLGPPLDPVSALTWWGRNVCAVVGVGITTLLLMSRLRTRGSDRRRAVKDGGPVELTLVLVVSASLVAIDHASGLPVTFLLPATAVWVAMRFPPLVIAAHTLAAAAATLGLTMMHRGPFSSVGDVRTGTLLAQLFVAMMFVVGLFITAMREETASLQADLLAQERERQEDLRIFARTVAHDLRSPLTVIDGWADELARALDRGPLEPPPGASDMLLGIARASGRMRALVDGLLADATADDRHAEPENIQIDEVVRQIASDRGQSGAITVCDVTVVHGDPVLIHQLLDNLLGNAFKYARPGSAAEVAVTSRVNADGRIVIRVTDRGTGIPDGAHDWIFEPFRRAHGDEVSGTGLGLSTCRRIVERHGGRIRAESRSDGPGAAFEFDLPAPPSFARSAATATTATAPPEHAWLTEAQKAG